MSAFDYVNSASTAKRLLARFGAAAVLKRTGAAAYDPTTGTMQPTVTSLPTIAAVFAYKQQYINGTLILQGDQQAFCTPDVEPKQGDVMAWQGKDYTVVNVKPLAPAGVPVLFEAQLRG